MTPGQGELASSEIDRAAQALKAAASLLDIEGVEGAANRIYYATFHAGRAALAVKNRSTRTHSGQISLFEETFGAEPALSQLLQQHIAADYSTEPYEPSIDALRRFFADAEDFVAQCRRIVEQSISPGPTEPDPPPDS